MSAITRSVGFDEFVKLYNAQKISYYNMGGPDWNQAGDIHGFKGDKNSEDSTAKRLIRTFYDASGANTQEEREKALDKACDTVNSYIRALKANNRHADAETFDIRHDFTVAQLPDAAHAYLQLANASVNKKGELFHWIEIKNDDGTVEKVSVTWEPEKYAPIEAKAKEEGIRALRALMIAPAPAAA